MRVSRQRAMMRRVASCSTQRQIYGARGMQAKEASSSPPATVPPVRRPPLLCKISIPSHICLLYARRAIRLPYPAHSEECSQMRTSHRPVYVYSEVYARLLPCAPTQRSAHDLLPSACHSADHSNICYSTAMAASCSLLLHL